MYKITCDGLPLYHPLLEEYPITSGNVSLEVNTAGSLSITIPENNNHYGLARLMKSIITLYDDNKIIFKGRPYAPNRNLYRDNAITCEGSLAFFNDSIQEPFEYFGDVATLFRQVVEAHNSQVDAEKRFIVGNVTVTNSTEEGNITRSSIEYMSTWDFMKEKFFESALGGYLCIRYEDDGTYIDYLEDLNFLGDQEVEQGINLEDVKESVTCDNLATAIIPLGAKDENDVYVTIESVNNGVKYIYDEEAVNEYGWIFKVVKHDDINDPYILLRTGAKDLADAVGVITTVELTASDLSKAGYNVSPFSFGTYVDVKIDNLNIDRKMLIKKLSFELLQPDSIKITVGDSIKSFTNNFGGLVGSVTSAITSVETIKKKKAITSQDILFYLSTSSVEPTGGEWTSEPPQWVDGSFYWQKVTTHYSDGTSVESTPICLTGPTGATGQDGADGSNGKDGATGATGQGVESITVEYYVSTSKETQTDGEWTTSEPTWELNKYLWIRNKIVYKNPTSTAYTVPYCDSSWEAVNVAKEDLQNQLDNANSTIVELDTRLYAELAKTEDKIISTVQEEYYTKSDTDNLVGKVSTSLTQTKESFDMTFTELTKQITNLDGTVNANYNELVKYIRFKNGTITLGEVNNPLTLTLSNDRMSFLQNNVEVAYVSDNKLFIYDGEFLHSLKIGRWVFIPRENGNLSFTYV